MDRACGRGTELEIQELGIIVHGIPTACNLVGLVYNLRRGNFWPAVFHGAGLWFHADAVIDHVRSMRQLRRERSR